MLKKTLIITALCCSALTANADSKHDHGYSGHDHGNPWPWYPNPRPTYPLPPPPSSGGVLGGQKTLVENLKVSPPKETNFQLLIEAGNGDGKSHVAVVYIAAPLDGVNIYCKSNDVTRQVVELDNKVEHGTARFSTDELTSCNRRNDELKPNPSDVRVECDFDGRHELDVVTNYTETIEGKKTVGQLKSSQVSASCSVTVNGKILGRQLDGELTQVRTK